MLLILINLVQALRNKLYSDIFLLYFCINTCRSYFLIILYFASRVGNIISFRLPETK